MSDSDFDPAVSDGDPCGGCCTTSARGVDAVTPEVVYIIYRTARRHIHFVYCHWQSGRNETELQVVSLTVLSIAVFLIKCCDI